MLLLLSTVVGFAEEPTPIAPPPAGEVFGVDTAVGRVSYHPGRGLRVGTTGLTIGGFVQAEMELLQGEDHTGGFDSTNFFLTYDPTSFLHVFSEIEIGPIAMWESGRTGPQSDGDVEVARLFADLSANDALNLRIGKFLTPIGRWNLAPAEPLTWTTSDPAIVEDVFDEVSTGAMLWGSFFPRSGAFSYSLYGTFFDPIAPDPEAPPARHSAGAHLEWAAGDVTLGASYFASEPRHGAWNHLGGLDVLWQPHARVELSAEAVFGEGTRRNGGLWGFFTQGVVEIVPTLYGIARYEHFDPPGSEERPLELFNVGLTWVPRPYVRLKVDYRFADHRSELAPPGLFGSLSILF